MDVSINNIRQRKRGKIQTQNIHDNSNQQNVRTNVTAFPPTIYNIVSSMCIIISSVLHELIISLC